MFFLFLAVTFFSKKQLSTMKRRDFTEKISFASLGIALGGGAMLYGCNEEGEMNSFRIPDSFQANISVIPNFDELKSPMNDYCLKSNESKFHLYKNVFRQKRVIVIADNYLLLDIKKDKFGKDIDCVLRLTVIGILKCNFDIYKGGYQARKIEKTGKISHTIMSEEGLKLKVVDLSMKKYTVDFPLRFLEFGKKHVVLQEGFQMPCFMTVESIKESNFNTLINI